MQCVFIFSRNHGYPAHGGHGLFFYRGLPYGVWARRQLPYPNFTYDFYLGWTPIVASVAGLGGVFVFTKWLQHWPLRYVFQGVAVVRILLVGVEVWQAGRHNLGRIDDGLLFLLSEGIIGPVISMMYLLPLVAVTSRMMPKGSEALTYGILAGYQNFEQVIANSLGLMLIEQSGVGQDCSFVDYPFLVFCGHIMAPLATIPLAVFSYPRFRSRCVPEEPPKKIPEDDDRSSSSSLWRRRRISVASAGPVTPGRMNLFELRYSSGVQLVSGQLIAIPGNLEDQLLA